MDRFPTTATTHFYRWRALMVAWLALASSGCMSGSLRERPDGLTSCASNCTRHQTAFRIENEGTAQGFAVVSSPAPAGFASAEETLAAAQEADRREEERCVDLYYRAALQAAPMADAFVPEDAEVGRTYDRAMNGLICAGQRYKRLDPRRQLVIRDGGTRVVPIKYFGFPWQPGDFCELTLADQNKSDELSQRYAVQGLGVSLVATRVAPSNNELFFRHRQAFPVTAVLRPVVAAGPGEPQGVLEFYNPYTRDTTHWNGSPSRLSRDLSAAYAATINDSPRQYLTGFTAPTDTSVKPKLIMVEPYQRGKIPIIFIHGLYSDPITWVDTANDLRSQPDISNRYQFWVFRYPTGGEVLDSAAQLRENLQLARQLYDPEHTDPALDQMLIVGHSLGGLVAKSMVVTSSDILWRQIADQPFAVVQAPPTVRTRLERSFFFAPMPFVTRVIFIGTPHCGSSFARRLPGRLGSYLVSFGTEEKEQYRELMDANQGVFKPIVTRRRPTTVDMLDPDSPFLVGLLEMPINPSVRMHSIVGTGGVSIVGEKGDGVVSVPSARHCGVLSELFVPAKHEYLHREPESVAEIARIMREHAADAGHEVIASSARRAN